MQIVVLHNRSLSPIEITANYANGCMADNGVATGLVYYAKLNESARTAIADWSGNGLTSVATNGTWTYESMPGTGCLTSADLNKQLCYFTSSASLNTISYFTGEVLSANDYYAFGANMPGRNFSSNNYRYGFNGKENDNETVGTGSGTQDYGFRIYNPALGRFLSIDPLSDKYPELTPYQFASNTPIQAIDLDGLERNPPVNNDGKTKITTEHSNNLMYAMKWLVAFRVSGRTLSEYGMTRYLQGKGGYDVFSYKTLAFNSFSIIPRMTGNLRDGNIRKLNEKIADGNVGKVETSESQAKNQIGSALYDLGTFLGSFDIISYGKFDVKKGDDGNTYVDGVIYFTLRDTYQWKSGKFDPVDHDKMLTLKDLGAKDFGIRSYYKMSVKGANGKYEYGEVQDSSKDEYQQQEQPRSDTYDLPDGAKETNNYSQYQ